MKRLFTQHDHRIGRGFRIATRAMLDLVYPRVCIVCGCSCASETDQILLCGRCRTDLPLLDGPTCQRCGLPSPVGLPEPDDCPDCRRQKPYFDRVLVVGLYEGLLRRLILETKQAEGECVAMMLARFTLSRLGNPLAKLRADVVVATPMHWRRRMSRGTNATELLASPIAKSLRVPFAPRLLRRRRNTLPQFRLPQGERFSNVRDAFAKRASYHLKAAHVLLVDDILTTGATASETARALKANGAARVTVLALARSVGNR